MKNIAKNDKVVVVMTVLSVLALMSVVAMPAVAIRGDVLAVAGYTGSLPIPTEICDGLTGTVFALAQMGSWAAWTGSMPLQTYIAGVGALAIGL